MRKSGKYIVRSRRQRRPGSVVRVAVVGCGRWGINFIRVLQHLEEFDLVACADPNSATLRRFNPLAKNIPIFSDTSRMLAAVNPEAVVVATPATQHHRVVAECLQAGADVLVEKPLATSVRAATDLVALARARRRVLMVGHIFQYHGAVSLLKRMIQRGQLGGLRYLYAVRTNLGPIRDDVDVFWDLASHDVSMMIHLTGDIPNHVSAGGMSYLRRGNADVAFGTLYFRKKRVIGHVHASWLDPHKVRRMTVIGTRRMAVFDDVATQEPLRLYDRGVIGDKVYGDFGQFQMMLRDGDIQVPHVERIEPLRVECGHWLECIRNRRRPLTDGVHGLRVVKVLEALSASLRGSGRPVKVR